MRGEDACTHVSCPGGRDLCAKSYCRRRSRGRTTRARSVSPTYAPGRDEGVLRRTRDDGNCRVLAANNTPVHTSGRPVPLQTYRLQKCPRKAPVFRGTCNRTRSKTRPAVERCPDEISADVTPSTYVSRQTLFTKNVLCLRSFRTWPKKSMCTCVVRCARVLRARARTITAGHHVNPPAGTNRFRTREHTDGQAVAAAAVAAVAGGRGRRSRVRPTLGCHPQK